MLVRLCVPVWLAVCLCVHTACVCVCVEEKSLRSRERCAGGGNHRQSLWEKSEDASSSSSSYLARLLALFGELMSSSLSVPLVFLCPKGKKKNPVFCSKQMTETKSASFDHSLELMKKTIKF